MAKGYSARGGFSGGSGMMRQQQQMQQKLLKMQQEMTKAQEEVENRTFTSSVGGGVVQATVNGKKELTDLVISAIGDIDPLRTPRTSGRLAAARYLLEVDQTYIDGVRRQMLHTTVEDVLAFADDMERICSVAGSCVIGSRELIEKCGNRLDTVTELN
jgi:Zn-dependent M16 (insulinase) family peptidase